MMNEASRANLATSLRSAAADLSAVADSLSSLVTHDGIEKQAEILDHVADSAREGAIIVRSLNTRSGRPPLPQGIRRAGPSLRQVASEAGGDAT